MRFFVAMGITILLLSLAVVVCAQTPPPGTSVTIRWNAVTTMNDGTPLPAGTSVTYNLYGGHNPGGPWSAPISLQGTSTIRYGVDLGQLCYYETATVNGKESLPSPVSCITVTATPSTVPSAPTNLTISQNP